MTFGELLRGETVSWAPSGRADEEVLSLSRDSRAAGKGSLFFCIVGTRYDGHALAADAYRRGCRHFVAERIPPLPGAATILLCGNARRKLAELAARYHGDPASELSVVGITGTKGKTTTALMAKALLEAVGVPCGYIGSLGVWYDGKRIETENTTPDATAIHFYLRAMREAGISTVMLEVSSQALAHGRVHGIPLTAAVFTNLSRDHIGEGEHGSMAEYRAAKLSLFSEQAPRTAILNAGDPFCKEIAKKGRQESVVLFGKGRKSEYRSEKIEALSEDNHFSTRFDLKTPTGRHSVSLSFAGEHYVENLLGALAVACTLSGKPTEAFLPCIPTLRVPGRCEVIPVSGSGIFVIDYAHNGASLKAALRGLRPYTAGRLFCLFGAVGDRVRCRRRDMARAASRYADFSVITEDDPGEERPEEIAAEILSAFPDKRRAISIPDRERAIRYLLGEARPGDVVLLAGKGSEQFQKKAGGRIPFSEVEILRRFAPPARL